MLDTPYRLVSDRRPPQLLQRWLPIGLAVASALLLAEVARLRTENGKLRLSLERHAPHPPHAVFEEAAPHEGSCTCEAAQRSPLFLEYAYRSGLCPGAPAALGPSWTTEDCLQDVWGEYNAGGDFNGARPVLFNASVAGKHAVFEGVRWAQIPAGEVTEAWACNQANGCLDCPPSNTNQGCSEARGAAMVWVPEGASSRTPRILCTPRAHPAAPQHSPAPAHPTPPLHPHYINGMLSPLRPSERAARRRGAAQTSTAAAGRPTRPCRPRTRPLVR